MPENIQNNNYPLGGNAEAGRVKPLKKDLNHSCQVCQKPFQHRYAGTNQYCSTICRNRALSPYAHKVMHEKSEAKFARHEFPTTCACGCGQSLITKTRWDYGLGRPRRFLPYHKATIPRIKIPCTGCGKNMIFPPWISAKRKYCSTECYQKNSVRIPHHNNRLPRLKINCVICGKEFFATKREIEKRYRKCCSKECSFRYVGLSNSKRESKSPVTHRRRVLATRPHRCEKCGYDKIPEILTVHHIDGNKANGTDSNLLLVCWNCHMEMEFIAGTGPYRYGANNKKQKKLIPENFLSRHERIATEIYESPKH